MELGCSLNVRKISGALTVKRSVMFFTLLLLLNSVLRGIRFPNIWSYTHYLFDYDYGFIKRGLIGSIVNGMNVPFLHSYDFFVFFSFSIFFASMVLLLRLVGHSWKPGNLWFNLCVFLFCSSPAVVLLSHTVGYFDHIGLLVTLIILNISSSRLKLAFSFPLFLFCLFTHEAAFILFFPVVFVSLLNDMTGQGKPSRKYIYGLVAFSLMAIATTYTLSQSIISEENAVRAYEMEQVSAEVTLRSDAYAVLHRSGDENSEIMETLWLSEERKWEFLDGLRMTLPTLLFISFVLVLYLKQLGMSLYLIILSVLASYSPLLLHYFAWDMHRFNTLAVTTSFLVLLVFFSTHQATINTDRLLRHTGLVVAILIFCGNLMFKVPLFDGYEVKSFPFAEHYRYWKDVDSGMESFPWVPLQ